MAHPYQAFCQDFYVNMRLHSHIGLPTGRETTLHFFEQIQKAYPALTRFRKGDGTDLHLEEDRSNESYRWVSLESRRLASGTVNPDSIESALSFHDRLLDAAPHQLGLSPVEIDYLDILFGFDLAYVGNHDEVIAESLLRDSPLLSLAEEEGVRTVDLQPSITIALSDDCRTQARVDIVTRTNSQQVRSGDYPDEAISVYLVVRRYWGDRPKEPLPTILHQLAERAEGLCSRLIVPKVLASISAAIASRS